MRYRNKEFRWKDLVEVSMENLVFTKYRMSQVIRIRKLSTAHYMSHISNYQTPPHSHDAWEFVFCSQGSVRAYFNQEECILKSNQIILHPPRHDHHLEVGSDKATIFVLAFECNSETLKLLQNKTLRVDQSQRRMLMMIIQELGNAFELENGQIQLGDFHPSQNQVLGSEQMITGYMEGFLIGLLRDVTNQNEQRWDAVTLERALENRLSSDIKAYIENHLSERITLADLADHVHYSRSYITDQFQKSTGLSIARYISERRIEKAKQMLTEGNCSISQISESLGFSTVQYFSKCFKDAVGCSPSLFAKLQNIS